MNFEKALISLLFLALTLVIFLILRAVFFKFIHSWAERTHTELDNLIISTIKFPSILWCIGISLYIVLDTAEIPIKYNTYLVKSIHVLIIFSITVALANLVSRLLSNYIQHKSIAVQSTGLLNTILKGVVYIIGIIIILNIFGVSIAPLITALGIGGLAVALALKDTLENLFAGIHIMAEKTIRVGDFIRLETGQEGYVEDISWRTTRIRMIPNNLVIIPNSKLAQSVVINYHLPEKRLSLQIPVSVSYSADPENIEKILIEEIKNATPEIPGLLSSPEPVVRFIPGFGENSLDFTIVCQIEDVSYQFNVQNELRKRIFRRFKEEGIEIPFPQRVVWLKKES